MNYASKCFVAILMFSIVTGSLGDYPKEWSIMFAKYESNVNLFRTMNDDDMFVQMSKCVDFDFLHDAFLDYCLMLSIKVMKAFSCVNQTRMECILSTYYMDHRFSLYKQQHDSLEKRKKKTFSGPFEIIFGSSYDSSDEN